jgi:hypothetical protein
VIRARKNKIIAVQAKSDARGFALAFTCCLDRDEGHIFDLDVQFFLRGDEPISAIGLALQKA